MPCVGSRHHSVLKSKERRERGGQFHVVIFAVARTLSSRKLPLQMKQTFLQLPALVIQDLPSGRRSKLQQLIPSSASHFIYFSLLKLLTGFPLFSKTLFPIPIFSFNFSFLFDVLLDQLEESY